MCVCIFPGFQKDRLKIQITSTAKLRVSGDRPIGHNKWRQFVKEFPLADDSDTNKISAKFEGGILYIKVPKAVPVSTTTPKETAKPKPTTPKPTTPKPTTPKPTSEPAELVEPTKTPKKTPTPPPSTADQRQPPQPRDQPQPQPQPPQQQKEVVPPKPAAAPAVDKQQEKEVPANAEKKDHVKEVAPNDKKASDQKTFEKAEKVTPPPPSAAAGGGATTKPEKKPVPDGSDPKKAAEKKARDVVDRSAPKPADSEAAGRKKGIVKNPAILVNVAVAALIIVVLALYAKNAFRFFEQSSSSASADL